MTWQAPQPNRTMASAPRLGEPPGTWGGGVEDGELLQAAVQPRTKTPTIPRSITFRTERVRLIATTPPKESLGETASEREPAPLLPSGARTVRWRAST